MLVGQIYKLPDIDSRTVTYKRQFIGKRYLYVAGRVLGKLAHLSRAGIGGMKFALNEFRIKFTGFLCRFRIDTAYDTIVMNQLIYDIARRTRSGQYAMYILPSSPDVHGK